MEKREFLINLSIVAFSFLIIFALFEATLHLGVINSEDQKKSLIYCQGPEERRVFHEHFGWVEHPNSQFIRSGSNLFTHNSEGFRDTYNTGSKNIIVLGDSYAQGYNAGDNATFPFLLDKWSPDTSFLNYGMGGYGTDQELMVYRNKSKDINHSTVVLTYYLGNDATDNLKNHSRRPTFQETKNGFELTALPKNISRSQGSNTSSGVIRNPILDRIQGVLAYTATYRYLEPKLEVVYLSFIGSGWTPQDEELKKQLDRTKNLVSKLSAEAEKNNANVTIVTIPERGEIYRDEPSNREYSAGKPYWDAQRSALSKIEEQNDNLRIVNSISYLEEASKSGRVYGKEDAHLTEYGYYVLSKKIYQELEDQSVLKEKNNFTSNYDKEYSRCP